MPGFLFFFFFQYKTLTSFTIQQKPACDVKCVYLSQRNASKKCTGNTEVYIAKTNGLLTNADYEQFQEKKTDLPT